MTDKTHIVVQTGVERSIGLIAINNSPVNALGAAVRSQLLAAIAAHDADPEVRVIAIWRRQGFRPARIFANSASRRFHPISRTF